MRFTKMHGAGNDYVYVSAFDEALPDDIPALARRISNRHFGVGSDGLIVIGPSTRADARMRMWNADGTEAEMCGNGLRCVARYLYDRGIVRRNPMRIETGRGVLTAVLNIERGAVHDIRINMGSPHLCRDDIPTTLPGNPPLDARLDLPGGILAVTAVSMGNPHAVVFFESLTDHFVRTAGPQVETHPAFPRRTNVEFVQVLSPAEIRIRVWERGAGETLACGTGACAAVVAGVLTGRLERRALCHLPGGDLSVEWSPEGDVFLTGPAEEVFTGDYPLALSAARTEGQKAAA